MGDRRWWLQQTNKEIGVFCTKYSKRKFTYVACFIAATHWCMLSSDRPENKCLLSGSSRNVTENANGTPVETSYWIWEFSSIKTPAGWKITKVQCFCHHMLSFCNKVYQFMHTGQHRSTSYTCNVRVYFLKLIVMKQWHCCYDSLMNMHSHSPLFCDSSIRYKHVLTSITWCTLTQIAKQINLILILLSVQSSPYHIWTKNQTLLYYLRQALSQKKIKYVMIQHTSTIKDLLLMCSTHN